MNKQEAIELLRDVAQTGKRSVHIDNVVELINQIDEPQKVVMPEFVNTKDFTTPIESLKADLEFIQTFYDVDHIKDRENAELLIDSYKYAIELLTNSEVE